MRNYLCPRNEGTYEDEARMYHFRSHNIHYHHFLYILQSFEDSLESGRNAWTHDDSFMLDGSKTN